MKFSSVKKMKGVKDQEKEFTTEFTESAEKERVMQGR